MRERLSMLLILGLSLPFVGKPVHIDDANFLAMAQHAAEDPWRPHGFTINWQGTSEMAFHVLSNPPGVAWWLAPVSHLSVFWMHLWMMPWLFLAMWGSIRLGRATGTSPSASLLLLCGAPISVIATQALTPDLPLLALCLAGMGGLLTSPPQQRWPFALILGTASLFRYSGLALIPLVFLLTKNRREQLILLGFATFPIGVLMVHDWFAYGQIHLHAMTAFQAVSNSAGELAHKAIASVAALGGVAALPILCWHHKKTSLMGCILGALMGYLAAVSTGQTDFATVGTVFFTAAGGSALSVVLHTKDATDRFLLAWLAIGGVFLLTLRFSASRYWIPFFTPVVLLALRNAPRHLVRIACALTLMVSAGVAIDDMDLAVTHHRVASRANTMKPGHFAGHWGFQYHLEKAGWTPVEDDQSLPQDEWVATSDMAWPQRAANQCWGPAEVIDFEDPRPGVRVMSRTGASNLHGHMLAGEPPTRTFSPWWFGTDPLDTLTLRKTCP